MLKVNVCETSTYKLLQMKIFESYNSLQQKIWSFKYYKQPLIKSLFCVLIKRIKTSESPVKVREKILNFTVILWKNYKFCRALAQFRGKTSCMSCRHITFSQVFATKVEMLAISWRQNNGKMTERDRSHVIDVWQSFKLLSNQLRGLRDFNVCDLYVGHRYFQSGSTLTY